MDSNGVTFASNFIEISLPFLCLRHVGGRTYTFLGIFNIYLEKKACLDPPQKMLETQEYSERPSLTHSWSWALLEKPPIVQLLKNFPAFYGTRRLVRKNPITLQIPYSSLMFSFHILSAFRKHKISALLTELSTIFQLLAITFVQQGGEWISLTYLTVYESYNGELHVSDLLPWPRFRIPTFPHRP
jgi:hypothetical protein